MVPDKLGLGLAFDQMAIKDYQICGPSRIGDRLEVPGRLKDLLLARELREVADPLAGLNVLPSDDPFPVDVQPQEYMQAPQRDVCYAGGCYHLNGDGVNVAYQWVWIPSAPSSPPPPPPPPSPPR